MSSTRVLLAAAIVLAGALAGCTGPSGTGDGPTPIPASRAHDTALAEARAWQADAELVVMSGVEASEASRATREVPDDSGRSSPRTWTDPDVGDGRAPGWTALFYSESANLTRTYRISEEQVEALGTSEPPSNQPTPVGRWSVDSPDAVGRALSNASFREAALASDGAVFMTLGVQDGAAVWELTARSHQSGERAVVTVPATGDA